MSIPSVSQEAPGSGAGPGGLSGDLMGARHRLSKQLLLRYGIVYYGGAAWTGAHDRWLRNVAAPQVRLPATKTAFDAGHDHVLSRQARRGRLDAARSPLTASSLRSCVGCGVFGG